MADLPRIVGELRKLQGLGLSKAEEAAAGPLVPSAELGEMLRAAGARVYFDRGNDSTKPCTFCGTRPAPTHKVMRLGTYANGEPFRRPVCDQCAPTAAAKATPRPAAPLAEDHCPDCLRPLCSEGAPYDENVHCPRSWSRAKDSAEYDALSQRDCYWSGLQKAKQQRGRVIEVLREQADALAEAAEFLLKNVEVDRG